MSLVALKPAGSLSPCCCSQDDVGLLHCFLDLLVRQHHSTIHVQLVLHSAQCRKKQGRTISRRHVWADDCPTHALCWGWPKSCVLACGHWQASYCHELSQLLGDPAHVIKGRLDSIWTMQSQSSCRCMQAIPAVACKRFPQLHVSHSCTV